MTWQYGDYTIWGWSIRKRNKPRACRTRAIKTCQRRVNRVPAIAGTEVFELVRQSLRTSGDKGLTK